ncbi:MAG: TraR/DksA family transcriptional regulator [Aureliella sp.]|jgi:DnaK suppressor protein
MKKNADDYAKFRSLLLELQRRLKGDVHMMTAEALGGDDADSGDNRAPIHPAEVGTHSFEQEFTLNRLSNDGDRLERIEAALDRIAQGNYGSCEECGGRIPKARLEVLPDTPYCVKCASSLGG